MAFESHETIRRPGASRRSGRSGCPGWKVHGAAVAQGAELRSLGDTRGFHHGDMFFEWDIHLDVLYLYIDIDIDVCMYIYIYIVYIIYICM